MLAMLARLRSSEDQEPAQVVRLDPDDLTDARLAELVTQGDQTSRTAAFDELYKRHVNAVFGYAYRRLGNREAAEDATSDIFRDVVRSIATFQPIENKTFRSWLFTIAHHIIADHVARQMREQMHHGSVDPLATDPAPSPADVAIAAEEQSWIRAQLAVLSTRERQVIELDLVGMKTQEIATVLGLDAGAVHTARCRALARLQAHLGRRDGTPEK
jgi:RNA polymerase sigma factor (sigma-70 family)